MRSAEFDRDYVLRSAMNEFLAKGYTKTSMQDLKRVTGLHPGSIYCAFENKRGLLIAALEHYAINKTIDFEKFFINPDNILQGFKNYLEDISHQCDCNQIKGCLLQKALSELHAQDEEVEKLIQQMIQQWKHRIQAKLEQAKINQEIPIGSDCEFLSDYLILSIYGLRSFAQTNPDNERLHQLVDVLMTVLKIGQIFQTKK